MESKKGFGHAMNLILEGRGFYIVIALCAAIIGVSIWSILRSPSPASDEQEFDEVLSDVEIESYDPVAPEIEEAEEEETLPEMTESQDTNTVETAVNTNPVWPLDGEISREYSMDMLQFDKTMSDWRTHDGIDILAEAGTKVLAVRSGTVQNVYADDRFGTCVVIDHGDGLIMTYANLQQTPTVYAGDTVNAGDVIGAVGETATAESAQETHLHLSALMNGVSANPIDYLPKKT